MQNHLQTFPPPYFGFQLEQILLCNNIQYDYTWKSSIFVSFLDMGRIGEKTNLQIWSKSQNPKCLTSGINRILNLHYNLT